MDYQLSESQQALAKRAREFLSKECPKSLVREMETEPAGYSPSLWKKMAELGWLGIAVPEDQGGAGARFLDRMVLVEEMGRALLPSPYFTSAVLSGELLSSAGSAEQRRACLEKMIAGDVVVSFAYQEPGTAFDPAATATRAAPGDGGFVLRGAKMFVPYAHVADHLLCLARTSGHVGSPDDLSLFLVNARERGVACTVLKTIADDRQCEVVLNDVAVPAAAAVGEVGRAYPAVKGALMGATALKCAEMVGGAQKALEMAVEYAKQRVQFGRPIGAFQSIQNYAAEMAVDVDRSRYATYLACWKIDRGLPAEVDVSVAKAFVSEACQRVVWLAHQIFASIAYFKEHDLQLYYRRARVQGLEFGDAYYHRAVIRGHLGLARPRGRKALRGRSDDGVRRMPRRQRSIHPRR